MRADPRKVAIVAGLALAYFVVFPDDLTALVAPLANLLGAFPTAAYILAGIALVCLTATSLLRPRLGRAPAPPSGE